MAQLEVTADQIDDVVKKGRNEGEFTLFGDGEETGSFKIKTADGAFIAECKNEDAWQLAELQTAGNSLHLGQDLKVGAAGVHMSTEVITTAQKSLIPHSEYDDTGTLLLKSPVLDAKQIRTVTHSDNSGYVLDTYFTYQLNNTGNRLISQVYFQTHTTAATSPVLIKLYLGTDNTGTVFYEFSYPSSEFPADSEITLLTEDTLGYMDGWDIFVEMSSDSDFSIKTNAAVTEPWRAYDGWEFVDSYIPTTANEVTSADKSKVLMIDATTQEPIYTAIDGFIKDSNGHMVTSAVVDTEYTSPNQHGDIYGTIYRQYFGAKSDADIIDLVISKIVDYVHHSADCIYSGNYYETLTKKVNICKNGANKMEWEIGTGVAIVSGWVDYTKP